MIVFFVRRKKQKDENNEQTEIKEQAKNDANKILVN